MTEKPERQAPGHDVPQKPGEQERWEYNPVSPPEWTPDRGQPREWRPSEPSPPAAPPRIGEEGGDGNPPRPGEYFAGSA